MPPPPNLRDVTVVARGSGPLIIMEICKGFVILSWYMLSPQHRLCLILTEMPRDAASDVGTEARQTQNRICALLTYPIPPGFIPADRTAACQGLLHRIRHRGEVNRNWREDRFGSEVTPKYTKKKKTKKIKCGGSEESG